MEALCSYQAEKDALFSGLTKMQLTYLLDGRSLLDTFFPNEVQKVLYRLVLVTDPLNHSRRFNRPSNFGKVVAITKDQFIIF